MVFEIVDVLAHIERRLTLAFATQSDVVSAFALLEKSRKMVSRAACSDHTISATVDVFHSFGFGVEVAAWALNDTEGIDPEVATTQSASHSDCISKGGWEGV
jgi:hypothetical protein